MSDITKIVGALASVRDEIIDAQAAHAPMNSLHEAYAVILEELDELWEQVKLKRSKRDPKNISTELTQIAAMAIRAQIDLGFLPVRTITKFDRKALQPESKDQDSKPAKATEKPFGGVNNIL